MDIAHTNKGSIKVADVTILHLSRGLYRSTATAFKELVSNSYDADAVEVRINTNFPEFDFISCVDNGNGMSINEFLKYFNQYGIGTGTKRSGHKDKTEIYNRPLIGRMGIGMMAIGQICHSFEIESHYIDENKKGVAYQAEIILLDEDIPDKESQIRADRDDIDDFDVGRWEYGIIPFEEKKIGFRIYSSDVRETFTNEMKSSVDDRDISLISFDQDILHEEFFDKGNKSIRECKPYLETIWELASLCPIPYYGTKSKYPIDFKSFKSVDQNEEYNKVKLLINQIQNQFLNENFRVIFDGIELRRHISLPNEEDIIPKVYYLEYSETILDNKLSFVGYIFAQVSKYIKPLEVNGFQIRLRGVGIGGYDSTFLKYYKQVETVRSKWLSGEIFINQGLESALTINRDGFNEHDEHYKALQTFIHDKLDSIFSDIEKTARMKRDKKKAKNDEIIQNNLNSIFEAHLPKKYKLKWLEAGDSKPFVYPDKVKKEIIINISVRPFGRKIKANNIMENVLISHCISRICKGTENEKDNKFNAILKEVLSKII